MELTKIDVESRDATGTKQVRRLREDGLVPAILYGAGKDPLKLAVKERELQRHLRQQNRVFVLNLGGQERSIYLQDIQYDCLTDRPVHVDFRRIDMDEMIHLKVSLDYIGHPVGASKGGVLIRDLQELPISSLPASIPKNIPVSVTHMEIGDSIMVSELELPEGVKADVPEEAIVCHMVIPAKVVEEVDEVDGAAEDGEADEAGEAGEAGEGGEGGDGSGSGEGGS